MTARPKVTKSKPTKNSGRDQSTRMTADILPRTLVDDLEMMTATMVFEPSQMVKKRVRNVLFCVRQMRRVRCRRTSSSRVGFSISSCGSNGAIARLTVCSNAASTSSCAASATSATAGPLPSVFFVSTDGSASALSEPFVPQLTSCRLASE